VEEKSEPKKLVLQAQHLSSLDSSLAFAQQFF